MAQGCACPPAVRLAGTVRLDALRVRPCPLPPPGPDEVALWRVACPPDGPLPAALRQVLDAGERARADRFLRQADRRRFTVAHGVLRHILAAAVGRDPAALTFGAAAQGKPFLLDEAVDFNISHSGTCVLVAVTVGAPVGVDVEAVRGLGDADALVARFYAPEEQRAFAACAAAERPGAFFTLWTRKEAYVKALGQGLSLGLATFAVSLDEPARVVRAAAAAPLAGPRLCGVPVPAGFVGAVAGWFGRIVCRDVALVPDGDDPNACPAADLPAGA